MPKSQPIDITLLSPVQRMELADLLYDSAIAEIELQIPSLTSAQVDQLDREITRSIASHSY